MNKLQYESLLSEIKELFDKSIKNTNIFKYCNDLSDAVSAFHNINPRPEEKIMSESNEKCEPEKLVFFALGHIPANPSKYEETYFLKNSYVFLDPNNVTVIDRRVPNYNTKSAYYFLTHELKSSAELEAKIGVPINKISDIFTNHKIFIMHGPRGIGKTYFLNKLMSEYSEIMDESHCLIVRINLIDTFGGDNPSVDTINHWLCTKLALVVLRYYNRESPYCTKPSKHVEVKDYINRYLNNKISENERLGLEYTKQWDIFYRLCTKTPHIGLHEGLLPLDLSLEIRELLLREGYSFIFVIDGLDRLDLTPRFRTRFEGILRSLRSTIYSETLHSALLLVLRDESYDTVLSRITKVRVRPNKWSFVEKEIRAPEFSEIVKERIKSIKEYIKMNEELSVRTICGSDIDSHLDEFQQYISREVEPDEAKETLKFDLNNFNQTMRMIFFENNRAKAQLLQLTYKDFLDYKRFNKHYIFVERMCKGGFQYPPVPHYSVDDNSIIVDSFERVYDNIFLPNIFHYPYAKNKQFENAGHAASFLLAGYRLMVLLRAIEKYRADSKNYDPVSGGYLSKLICKSFLYEKSVIFNIILMFSEYDILEMNGIPMTINTIANHDLKSLPKLSFILDKMLSDVAYLNICAMRIPLTSRYIENTPVLFSNSIEDDDDIDKFSSKKIINVITLVRILSTLDSIEKEAISKMLSREDSSLDVEEKQILNYAIEGFKLFDYFDRNNKLNLFRQIQGILKKIDNGFHLKDFIIRTWDI